MRPKHLILAALITGGLVAPAQATGGLSCTAEGVSLNLTLGRTVIASVAGAYLTIGEESWSTAPDVVKGTPIVVGQAFSDEKQLLVDFTDDIVNEIVARLRLSIADGGETQVIGGTLEMPGRGAWVVACEES